MMGTVSVSREHLLPPIRAEPERNGQVQQSNIGIDLSRRISFWRLFSSFVQAFTVMPVSEQNSGQVDNHKNRKETKLTLGDAQSRIS